jgi:hypothetical protein
VFCYHMKETRAEVKSRLSAIATAAAIDSVCSVVLYVRKHLGMDTTKGNSLRECPVSKGGRKRLCGRGNDRSLDCVGCKQEDRKSELEFCIAIRRITKCVFLISCISLALMFIYCTYILATLMIVRHVSCVKLY